MLFNRLKIEPIISITKGNRPESHQNQNLISLAKDLTTVIWHFCGCCWSKCIANYTRTTAS